MILRRIISGGQSGADQAGWRSAKAVGLACGGWMPRGYLTEDGPRPEFAEMYGVNQHVSDKYPPRTRKNIEWADATVIFDTTHGKRMEDLSRGTQLALKITMELNRPSLVIGVDLAEPTTRKRTGCLAGWVLEHKVTTLNVAGNRESSAPGIGAWVEAHMLDLFRVLAAD